MAVQELDFLAALSEAPSPSGYEEPAARVFREHLRPYADELETSVLGSVHATLKGNAPAGKGLSVLLAGHIDQVGFQVAQINDEGFITLHPVGMVDPALLPGKRLDVHTSNHGVIRGTIGRKPVHIYEYEVEAYPKTIPIHNLFLDVGLTAKEAREKIGIGDPVVYGTPFTEFGDGLAFGQSLDDKVGAWVAARVLEEVKAAGGVAGDVVAAGTVQEEIGYRGGVTSGRGIDPDLAIVVEVGGTQDYPFADKKFGANRRLGGGPILARGPNFNPKLLELLTAAAKEEDIPYQQSAWPFAEGTDACVIQLLGSGKPVALVSVPLRYMHSPVEVISLVDLDRTVRLITRFILDLDANTDFTPTLRGAAS